MSIDMELDEMLFNMLEDDAREEGYADFEEQFTADIDEDAWGQSSTNRIGSTVRSIFRSPPRMAIRQRSTISTST